MPGALEGVVVEAWEEGRGEWKPGWRREGSDGSLGGRERGVVVTWEEGREGRGLGRGVSECRNDAA